MEILGESNPDTPTTCFYHRGRETGRKCSRCGRPACPDCLHQASVGSHCWECIKAAAPARTEQIKRAVRGENLLVTKILIAINVAVFVATAADGGFAGAATEFHVRWALWGPPVADGEWYRVVTSGFLHYGIIHLAMNMYALFLLGGSLEGQGAGRGRFVAIYLASLLMGSFVVLLISPDNLTAGASGAIYGLMGAVIVAHVRRGVPLTSSPWFAVMLFNFVFTFANARTISVAGHVGGFIGGAIVGFLLLDPRIGFRRPWLGYGATVAIAALALAVGPGMMQSRYGECVADGRGVSLGYFCERNP